jgi:hypothetical protein
VCSYQSWDNAPPQPICYWTAASCESAYSAETERRAKLPLPTIARRTEPQPANEILRLRPRAACEGVVWRDAARQYEQWSKVVNTK